MLHIQKPEGALVAPICQRCAQPVTAKRKDALYCCRQCQRAATRHTSRGSRVVENSNRTHRHYERAAWLSYDLNRMQSPDRREMLLALLEAASGYDAPLRNILLDPKLLGAERSSPIGKLGPDKKCSDALNIAKMANAFCLSEWGCGIRHATLDNGKPAGRIFREVDQRQDYDPPPHYR
ncbi:hypothetical protein [Ketogulonicigenium robustum]|uniref:hypothetical protein n=1 Tax=Ketogulonicigenium robustum TaxID=92947 RepID=UPI0012F4D94F|nr:hypothetical protein [Ketogulonicigenium robustum]